LGQGGSRALPVTKPSWLAGDAESELDRTLEAVGFQGDAILKWAQSSPRNDAWLTGSPPQYDYRPRPWVSAVDLFQEHLAGAQIPCINGTVFK
jgi:hypothetical protein